MFTKQISNFAKLGKEKMYNLVKSPDEMIKKVGDSVSDINTQIHNFQKEPNTNFMTSLNRRVPSKQSFQIEKPKNYGLTKELIHKGHFHLENAGKTSKVLNERIPSKSTFKQSAGVPSLNKYFDKLAPKNMDYRYVDPQTYEYKLNGLTQEKLIRNKMREEGEKANTNPDPEVLDSTSKFVSWREQDKVNKVNKIKSVYKNYSNEQALQEGDKLIEGGELEDDGDIQNKIKAGRAKRSQDLAPEIQRRKNKEQIAKEAKEEEVEMIEAYENEKEERELLKKLESRYTPEQKLIYKLLHSSNSNELLKGTKKGKIEKVQKMMQADREQMLDFKESSQDRKDRKQYMKDRLKQYAIDDSDYQTKTAFKERFDKLSKEEQEKIHKNLLKREQEELNNEALQIKIDQHREDQKKLVKGKKSIENEENKNRMAENEEKKYNEYKKSLTRGELKKVNKDVFKALEEQRDAKFKEEEIKQQKRGEENAKIQTESRLRLLTKAQKAQLAKEQAEKDSQGFHDGAEESKEDTNSRYPLRSHDALIKAKKAKNAKKAISKEDSLNYDEVGFIDEGEDEGEDKKGDQFNFSETDKKFLASQQTFLQGEISERSSRLKSLTKILNGELKNYKESSTKITKELKNKIEPILGSKIHGNATVKTVYNNLIKEAGIYKDDINRLNKEKIELPEKYAKEKIKKEKKKQTPSK